MMEYQNVPAAICFNKTDLVTEEELHAFADVYESCGYQTLYVSAKEEKGVDGLLELLKGKTAAVAGPSGVGKSSLDTYIMDTPGFSTLYIPGMEKEDLKEFYPEFQKWEPYCRFQGCNHISEPDCGVRQGLEEGSISPLRYENYKLLYEELKAVRKY